jgi:integrase
MRCHISVPAIKNLLPAQNPYEVVDDLLKGFLARVQPSGNISYYFTYRSAEGTKKRFRIGSHPSITAPSARKAAELYAAQVVQGGDPQQKKKSTRVEQDRIKHELFSSFIENKYRPWALMHHRRGDETLQLINRNFSFLYPKRMSNITAWEIQKWRAERGKAGYRAATINRAVTTLKAILNRAVEWDVINGNPLQSIKPMKLDSKPSIRYLKPNEEVNLRNAMDVRELELRAGRQSGNEWREVRDYPLMPSITAHFSDYLKPLILLAINTGLRRGEIFKLRWADIDLQNKLLTVRGETAKSKHTRHLPLNTEAMGLLKYWKQQCDITYVFVSPVTGQPFNNISNAWSSIRKKAELTDFRFHDLRHTFASKLVMSGIDLYTVKELMGHSTIQMTERYAHLAPEHKSNAVQKLVLQM